METVDFCDESRFDSSDTSSSFNALVQVHRFQEQDGDWLDLGTGEFSYSRINDNPESLRLTVNSNAIENETDISTDDEQNILEYNLADAKSITRRAVNVITWCDGCSSVVYALMFRDSNCCNDSWAEIKKFTETEDLTTKADNSVWQKSSIMAIQVNCRDKSNSEENKLTFNGDQIDQDNSVESSAFESDDVEKFNTNIDGTAIDNDCFVDEIVDPNILRPINLPQNPGSMDVNITSSEESQQSDEDAFRLPELSLNTLPLISRIFAACYLATPQRRQILLSFIVANVEKLFDLCAICSDLSSLDALHLSSILIGALQLHDVEVYSLLFDDVDRILLLVEVLSCEMRMDDDESTSLAAVDNEIAADKAGECGGDSEMCEDSTNNKLFSHRSYLEKFTFFNDIAGLACSSSDVALINLIHKTFRIQYILDVLMPQSFVFEDNHLQGLNTYLRFCKSEVVEKIMDSKFIIQTLLNRIDSSTDISIDDYSSIDCVYGIIGFFKELCTFISTSIIGEKRCQLFMTMIDFGLLKAVHNAITFEVNSVQEEMANVRKKMDFIKQAALDVFGMCIEHNVVAVWQFCNRQIRDSKQSKANNFKTNNTEHRPDSSAPTNNAVHKEVHEASVFSVVIDEKMDELVEQPVSSTNHVIDEVQEIQVNELVDHHSHNATDSICNEVQPPSVEQATQLNNSSTQDVQQNDENDSEDSEEEEAESILEPIVGMLVDNPDPECPISLQVVYLLKLLVDNHSTVSYSTLSIVPSTLTVDIFKDFLPLYCLKCVPMLFAPILLNTAGPVLWKDDKRTAQLQYVILDLLCYLHDSFPHQLNTALIDNKIAIRVLMLLSSSFQIVKVAVVRLIRKILGSASDEYDKFLTDNRVLSKIVDVYLGLSTPGIFEGAVLEMFDFVYKEDRAIIIKDFVDNVYPKVSHMKRGKSIYVALAKRHALLVATAQAKKRLSSIPVQMAINERDDLDECRYFEEEEDDDDGQTPLNPKQQDENDVPLTCSESFAIVGDASDNRQQHSRLAFPLCRKRSESWNCTKQSNDDGEDVEEEEDFELGRPLSRKLSASSIVFNINLNNSNNKDPLQADNSANCESKPKQSENVPSIFTRSRTDAKGECEGVPFVEPVSCKLSGGRLPKELDTPGDEATVTTISTLSCPSSLVSYSFDSSSSSGSESD